MNERCTVFEEFKTNLDQRCTDRQLRVFEEHLANCPSCSDQWIAHRALGDFFSEVAPPAISTEFGENLRRRMSRERGELRRRSLLMRLYWLAACIAIAFLFVFTKGGKMDGGVIFMMLLLCFALPTLFLGRILPVGLFDLILSTLNQPKWKFESYPSEPQALGEMLNSPAE